MIPTMDATRHITPSTTKIRTNLPFHPSEANHLEFVPIRNKIYVDCHDMTGLSISSLCHDMAGYRNRQCINAPSAANPGLFPEPSQPTKPYTGTKGSCSTKQRITTCTPNFAESDRSIASVFCNFPPFARF